MRYAACLLALVLVACGGSADQEPTATPDRTATRTVELEQLATIQADTPTPSVTETPLPTATSSPVPSTATSESSPTATTTPEATQTLEPSATPTEIPSIDIVSMLPTLDDFPSGYAVTVDTGVLGSAELAAGYQDAEAHLDRLQSWGFQQWTRRVIRIPQPGLNDLVDKVLDVDCAVIQYGSPDQVREASEFNRNTLSDRDDLEAQIISVDQIGEWTIALQGLDMRQAQQFIHVFVWAQVGDVQAQCRGYSGVYNPLPDIVHFVQLMVDRR